MRITCFSKQLAEDTIYVTRNGEGEVSNHIVMARRKPEEKALTEKSPQKKSSVGRYPFQLFEKNHNKKSSEGRFQKIHK